MFAACIICSMYILLFDISIHRLHKNPNWHVHTTNMLQSHPNMENNTGIKLRKKNLKEENLRAIYNHFPAVDLCTIFTLAMKYHQCISKKNFFYWHLEKRVQR